MAGAEISLINNMVFNLGELLSAQNIACFVQDYFKQLILKSPEVNTTTDAVGVTILSDCLYLGQIRRTQGKAC